jgi:hypothetical protein
MGLEAINNAIEQLLLKFPDLVSESRRVCPTLINEIERKGSNV